MRRDERAYLNDIVEACEAIAKAVSGLDLAAYRVNRLVRSSVEREFIIVGEAMAALFRVSPQVFGQITHAGGSLIFATSSRMNTRPSMTLSSGSSPSTMSPF